MGEPTVYIEREPLLAMLLAAVEVYHLECYGMLFGSRPTQRYPYYHISLAVVRQAVVRRTNMEIWTSARGEQRVSDFLGSVGGLYLPVIGDFHSHPAYHGVERHPGPSEVDIKGMSSKDGRQQPLGVIINIIGKNPRPIPWRRLDKKTRLRGSLAGYIFDVTACHVNAESSTAVPLVIEVAPTARKALNRASGQV